MYLMIRAYTGLVFYNLIQSARPDRQCAKFHTTGLLWMLTSVTGHAAYKHQFFIDYQGYHMTTTCII